MRNFLVAVLLLFGVYFLLTHLADVHNVIDTLRRGDWRWLAVGVVFHLAWLGGLGISLRSIYRLLGIDEYVGRLVLTATAANFAVVVTPSAGMGGIAVFVSAGQKRNLSSGRVTAAIGLYIFLDYLATLILLLAGFVILFRRNQLNGGDILASLVLLGMAIVLGGLLYQGMHSAERLGRALAWIGNLINRILRPFLRRDYVSVAHAYEFSHDATEGLRLARVRPHGLALPLALAVVGKVIWIGILLSMFMAFRQPLDAGTLVAGYGIGYLFTVVSPTPSGIGFAEGAMTLALGSLDVPLAAAALITLAFRGITLWLTLGYGMLALRWISRAERPPATASAGGGEDSTRGLRAPKN